MVDIVPGLTNKPIASDFLKNFFKANINWNGVLYIGYPVIGTVEGRYSIDALWISPEKGIVIFNLVEGNDISGYEEKQDDCANKLESKLKGYRQLVIKRRLCVGINVVTYAPAVNNLGPVDVVEDYPLCTTDEDLKAVLDGISWDNDQDHYRDVLSVLQCVSTIRKGVKRRETLLPNSRGSKVRSLEASIATLDNNQNRAVIETVDGVQRIRGLAGSGKTIVLALKAAYLHAQHPEWKIAITFNTRSLKAQLRKLVRTFYYDLAADEPNWNNIEILHAWGAPGGGERKGMYYAFCLANDVQYYDYTGARRKFSTEDLFGCICKEALTSGKNFVQLYDAILVDEAQDFSSDFLLLCYEMLHAPKRLVYAYDEMQNLRSQSLPSPEQIFGVNQDGSPRVRFEQNSDGKPRQDIILNVCYRNSRPVLVAAHALGFGIYRKNDEDGSSIIQMFEQKSLWHDIGYEVEKGHLDDGQLVVLRRTEFTSPLFLENHSDIDDLIQFRSFSSKEEQDKWVANEIEKNLNEDELRHDDIVVINPNPYTTKENVATIRSLLFQRNIASHTAGVDTEPDIFFTEENPSVAFSGIFRAKGNEAAMVYVVNAESCYESKYNLAKLRNQLFSAITRSKAWVRVLGVGEGMDGLIKEFKQVKAKGFKLEFIYPTQSQREHMNIVNRDMSESEKNHINKASENINALISDLESRQIYVEDLDKSQIDYLRSLLSSNRD